LTTAFKPPAPHPHTLATPGCWYQPSAISEWEIIGNCTKQICMQIPMGTLSTWRD